MQTFKITYRMGDYVTWGTFKGADRIAAENALLRRWPLAIIMIVERLP